MGDVTLKLEISLITLASFSLVIKSRLAPAIPGIIASDEIIA